MAQISSAILTIYVRTVHYYFHFSYAFLITDVAILCNQQASQP